MGVFLTLPFPLPNFSSWCLRRSDPAGLSPSLSWALQFSARREHGGGSPHHPRLSPTATPIAAPSAAAHHRPQTPAGSKLHGAPPTTVHAATLLCPPPLPGAVGRREAKLISSFCIHPKLQDPEVQKHATQILRNMLRQEEAELQVWRWHSSFLLWSHSRAALGAAPVLSWPPSPCSTQ